MYRYLKKRMYLEYLYSSIYTYIDISVIKYEREGALYALDIDKNV